MESILLIKLTDEQGRTYGDTRWGPEVTHSVPVGHRNMTLCGAGVIHAYRSVEQALLMIPVHARYSPPTFQLWSAVTPLVVADDGMKVGVWELTTVEQLPLPVWYTNPNLRGQAQVRFAVLCARATLPLYTRQFPRDNRPAAAIAAAEQWLLLSTSADHADAATHAANAAPAHAIYAADAANAAEHARAIDASVAASAARHAAYAAYFANGAAATYTADAASHAAHAATTAARAAAGSAGNGTVLDVNTLAVQAVALILAPTRLLSVATDQQQRH